MRACKHTKISGKKWLEKCPSCHKWFVIKEQTIVAMSNAPGPFPFTALFAYPSNFLGHTCGNEVLLRRLP